MRIDQDTAEAMEKAAAEHGEPVAAMTALGGRLADQPLFSLDRGLFGSKGEILAGDRYISFSSDRGFSRLKSSGYIPFQEIDRVKFDGSAPWFRWSFEGEGGKFGIELVNYTGRNGLSPSQIVWYDIDTYPSRSLLFYRATGGVIAGSAARSLFDHPSPVSRAIEEAVSTFEQSPRLVSEKLTQPDPFHLWTGVYGSFCTFLAGTTLSTEADREAWLGLFRDLDGFYARVIERFCREIEDSSGTLFSKEAAINNLSDQFDRLTMIWYVRQIARLHFADRYLDQSAIRPWSLSILTPRALHAGNGISIKLREKSMYEEEIRTLRS